MGEAKNRGSKQERFQQALDKFKPVLTDDLRRQLGMDEDCTFVGYVIHLPESDEFLAGFEDNDDVTLKQWGAIPDLALPYRDFHEAVKVLKAVSKSDAVLALLWENETGYFVSIPS